MGKDYLITYAVRIFDVKYRNTSENEHDTFIQHIFETNYESKLDDVINTVNTSIELKAIDSIYICSLVLESLNPNFKKLLLERAEYILIQRGKLPLLKIINNKKPESGIYINCNIQYSHSYLENEIVTKRKERIEFTVYTVLGAIVIGYILTYMFISIRDLYQLIF